MPQRSTITAGPAALAWLGPAARAWVFSAPEPLDEGQAARIVETVTAFLRGWESHGVRLPAGCALVEHRFLVVAADERTDPSGCSIDKLFRLLQELAAETRTTLLESHRVYFRDREGRIRGVSRAEFRDSGVRGEVDGDTIVFDTTVGALGDILEGRWEKPARESWHARLLG